MSRLLAALLLLGSPAAASIPDVAVSSPAARSSKPAFDFKLESHEGENRGAGPGGAATVGVGVGMKDGKALQAMLWGGGGAIIGSFAGPPGAAIGGAAGALVGLLIGHFIVPRQGRDGISWKRAN